MAESKISTNSFVLQNSIWWLGGMIVQTLILHYNAGFSWGIAAKDALTTNIIMALAAAETIIVMRHYQPRQSLRFIYSVALAAG